MDRNPAFGQDKTYADTARRVTDLLWETTGDNLAATPPLYLQSLNHEYSDGTVSLLPLLNRTDLPADATYEEFSEVVEGLIKVDPTQWPDPETILEVRTDRLREGTEDFSENFFDTEDFAEGDFAGKMSTFLKKTIATVYRDGVRSVTDKNGNPPGENNNFLMSEDGTEFAGSFTGAKGEKYPFSISQNGSDWRISY